MYAFELLAKCRHLTLCGVEGGELQWLGTYQQWNDATREEQKIIDEYEFNQIWR